MNKLHTMVMVVVLVLAGIVFASIGYHDNEVIEVAVGNNFYLMAIIVLLFGKEFH